MATRDRVSFWDSASGEDSLPMAIYSVILTLTVLYGIGLSAFGASLTSHVRIGSGTGFLGFMVLVGVTLVTAKRIHPIVTWLGYTAMALILGAFTGPLIAQYTAASMVKVFLLTSGVTVGLGLVGILIPRNLYLWGSVLMAGLIVLIFAQFGTILFGAFGFPIATTMRALDWVVVLIFSGFLVFDFNRAFRVPFNINNAFASGVEIYLDFANMFTFLAHLIGIKKD